MGIKAPNWLQVLTLHIHPKQANERLKLARGAFFDSTLGAVTTDLAFQLKNKISHCTLPVDVYFIQHHKK